MALAFLIVARVKTDWRRITPAAMLAGVVWLCGGCSGINRSIDVSPATFLLPGLIQAEPFAPSIPESFVAKESEITVARSK